MERTIGKFPKETIIEEAPIGFAVMIAGDLNHSIFEGLQESPVFERAQKIVSAENVAHLAPSDRTATSLDFEDPAVLNRLSIHVRRIEMMDQINKNVGKKTSAPCAIRYTVEDRYTAEDNCSEEGNGEYKTFNSFGGVNNYHQKERGHDLIKK